MTRNIGDVAFLVLLLFSIATSLITSYPISDDGMVSDASTIAEEKVQPAYQILGRRKFPQSDNKLRPKRIIETEGDRKPRLYPAISPFVRDTFPIDDTTLSIDLSDRSRIWSDSPFNRNLPRLFLSGKAEGKTTSLDNDRKEFLQERHLMNTNLLSVLRELNQRLKSTKWNQFPLLKEVSIPQEALENYLLDLLMERPSKERFQSLKTNILTEEMVLPLIWDEHVTNKYVGKQATQKPYKRTFLSQSWKPGGLPGLPSIPLQRNNNQKQVKPNPYRHEFSMSVLGPNGWRPGRKRSQSKFGKMYSLDEVGDIGDSYRKPPKMTKEVMSLHISSQNSSEKPSQDVRMQLKKDVLLNKDWDELRRPLMEKLEGKKSYRSKKDDWKMQSDERLVAI